MIDTRIAERANNNCEVTRRKEKHSEEYQFKRKKRLAFLDVLLDAYENGEISREGVREEVDTFMFEVSNLFVISVISKVGNLAKVPSVILPCILT